MSHTSGPEGRPRSVADQIRALAAQGLSRADIARMLGKRYQHVRNVLEGDKQRAAPAAGRLNPPGVAEPPATFGNVHRLTLEEGGLVRLPADVLATLGAGVGGVLIGSLEAERFVILSGRAAWGRIDDLMAPYRTAGGPLASDELIAERRAEAARDANG